MRLGTYVAVAVKELTEKKIYPGKTNVQKLIYFALPETLRKRLYQPYYYGPYCRDVQHTIGTLIKNEGILEGNNGLRVSKDFDLDRDEDPVFERMKIAAEFFAENDFGNTDKIAQLAKVHLLSRSDRKDAQENLVAHIKRQARFLGWKELALAGTDEIQQYIVAAEKLNKKLESATSTL